MAIDTAVFDATIGEINRIFNPELSLPFNSPLLYLYLLKYSSFSAERNFFTKYIRICGSILYLFFIFFCRFSLIKEHLVEFNQLAMANAEGSDNMLNRVMPKDNIGLAALLRTKEAAWDNGEYIDIFLNFSIYPNEIIDVFS